MSNKQRHDWESCERDFRIGQLSIRALSTKHDIPESTIRSKAKAEGWQRDLSAEVKAATQAKLSRTSSRSKIAQRDDAQVIENAANEAVGIITQHRKAIARWRSISERLANALEDITVDETNHDRFARSLNSGIDALGKAIRLERQAYKLDDEQPEESKSLEELMADLAYKESLEELT